MDIFNDSFDYGLINTFPEQNEILTYLHPENPYRSLIVCYKTGIGKTYASAILSHFYLVEGYKILFLSSSINSINNFKFEYNKMIIDSRVKSLENRITAKTFNKLHIDGLEETYGLIIIDEVHNLRENASKYIKIKEMLDNQIYSKILIMTATPMVDSVEELDSILKLTGEDNPKMLFSDNKSGENVEINYKGIKINNEILFPSIMKGKQLEVYHKSLTEDKNCVYTSTRQASISSSYTYNPKIPLEEQSSKIFEFIRNLKDNCPTVVFCFYVVRGIDFLSSVLQNLGYQEWNHYSTGKTYAIIDGRSNPKYTEEVLNIFNNLRNSKGELIHILIGSSVLTESITLFRVRELHILSPFWNYGQIEQSIGRTIRYGSHVGTKNKNINIYLHAACTNEYEGKDIDMWKIAHDKKEKIQSKLKEVKKITTIEKAENFICPEADNKLIFKVNNIIWDLSKCFDHNKFKISWCNVYYENIVGYDTVKKIKILSTKPAQLKINKPLPNGYTIWRSCIDEKLRISYMDNKSNKFKRRGKILSNVNSNDIEIISKDLGCSNNINSIVETLKNKKRYFNKQIEYDIQ